jgi:hypothetical protein
VLGIALTGALAVAGCGGGSSTASLQAPRPGQLREVMLKTEISELEREGVPKGQVACVEHKIENVSERTIAEWVVTPSTTGDPARASQAERLGPLGKGCF